MSRIRWSAGKDGRAHAHVSGRTLCHAPAIGERYAWPERARCPDCFRAAEALRLQSSGSLGQPGALHRAAGIGHHPEPAARESFEPER